MYVFFSLDFLAWAAILTVSERRLLTIAGLICGFCNIPERSPLLIKGSLIYGVSKWVTFLVALSL
jgi:hypothetical protein